MESSDPTRIEDSPGRELAARYRKLWPPGKNCGKPCATSARDKSREVTGLGAPPDAGTWCKMPTGRGQNRMTPSGLHAAPSPITTSAMSCEGPPANSILFSLLGVKKPTDWLSGDQNG